MIKVVFLLLLFIILFSCTVIMIYKDIRKKVNLTKKGFVIAAIVINPFLLYISFLFTTLSFENWMYLIVVILSCMLSILAIYIQIKANFFKAKIRDITNKEALNLKHTKNLLLYGIIINCLYYIPLIILLTKNIKLLFILILMPEVLMAVLIFFGAMVGAVGMLVANVFNPFLPIVGAIIAIPAAMGIGTVITIAGIIYTFYVFFILLFSINGIVRGLRATYKLKFSKYVLWILLSLIPVVRIGILIMIYKKVKK